MGSLPLPPARRILFAATSLFLCPLLLLALLEVTLRVAGYGHPTDFAIRKSGADKKDVWVPNPYFIKRFLPAEMPPGMIPHQIPFRLGDKKAPGTVRVYLVGESAAYGFPDPAFGMARFLEILLSRQYAGARFEVVNAAISGLNSNAFLPMAQCILKDLSPDLLVLFVGNNEVVGPYGALSPVGHDPAAVRLHEALAASRTGQLVKRLRRALYFWRHKAPGALGKSTEALMQATELPASDPRLADIHRLFSQNISDILFSAHRAGVGVVLGVPGCNLADIAPMASVHGPRLGREEVEAFDRAMAKAAKFAAQDNPREAAVFFQEAVSLDPDHAEAHYQLGKSLVSMGEYPRALSELKAARDADALRFRMDSAGLSMLRKAAGPGVVLADTEKEIEAASPHGIPGAGWFFDHVHMRVLGNYLAACSIMAAAKALLPEAVRKKEDQGKLATMEECLAALPFTGWDRLQQARVAEKSLGGLIDRRTSDLKTRLTFIQQEVRNLAFAGEPLAMERARKAYEEVLSRPGASWMAHEKYAELLLHGLKDSAGAAAEATRVLGEVDSWNSRSILSAVEKSRVPPTTPGGLGDPGIH